MPRRPHIPTVKLLLRYKYKNHLGEWREFTDDFLFIGMFSNHIHHVPALAKIIEYPTDQLRHALPAHVERYRDVRLIIWDNGNEILEFKNWKELTDHLNVTPQLAAALQWHPLP